MPTTYGQLPASPASGVAMFCPYGDDEGYSATRGDYFWADPAETVTCAVCGEPMELLRERTIREPID